MKRQTQSLMKQNLCEIDAYRNQFQRKYYPKAPCFCQIYLDLWMSKSRFTGKAPKH